MFVTGRAARKKSSVQSRSVPVNSRRYRDEVHSEKTVQFDVERERRRQGEVPVQKRFVRDDRDKRYKVRDEFSPVQGCRDDEPNRERKEAENMVQDEPVFVSEDVEESTMSSVGESDDTEVQPCRIRKSTAVQVLVQNLLEVMSWVPVVRSVMR